jgi:S-adenosylmethionine:tRNA ribosyltransferase-isomerase
MKIHPGLLAIKDFTYDLPAEKIAKYPLPERDSSRLLIYRDGIISEKKFLQLSEELPEKSLLVFNNTRVVRARILMQRISGATVEIFCTDAADSAMDFTRLLGMKKEVLVRAFIGNGKRWKDEEELQLKIKTGEQFIFLKAKRAGAANDQSIVKMYWEPAELSFAEIIEAAGKIPLPPYMDREEEAVDEERYQTVYAKHKGSVAAPTAGLHFTEAVLQSLEKKNIFSGNVTLHVGAGTFKPVKAGEMSGHEMHREQISVSRGLIEKILAQKNAPVIAVGTTALRTLESLYWFGKQIVTQPGRHFENLFVGQWEPYENTPDVPVPVALRAILDWMRENGHGELRGYTQVLIAPGYEFKIVNGLITNFHQPQSTLLLLVAAFIGEDYKRVYQYALENDFRFLSYGDSSLLWRG